MATVPRWDGSDQPLNDIPIGNAGSADTSEDANNVAFNNDVQRARSMGDTARNQAAPQMDLRNAEQSRGLQMGGLQMMQRQADGSAPSAAEIMSQRANQQAAQASAGAALGQKTAGGGGLAAFGQAAPAAANQALDANAQVAQQRAAEVSRGQAGLAKGANAAQGQDIATATTAAQLQEQQAQLNERQQEAFEGRAFKTREDQQTAARNDELAQIQARKEAEERAKEKSDNTKGWIGTGVKAGGTLLSMLSDVNTKKNMVPMGSLSRFRR